MLISFQAKAKSQERERATSEQSQRGPQQAVEAAQAAQATNVAASAPGGARATPSCPPEAALEVHDPLMYTGIRDPVCPPPYESVIMQECMKFPFADEV